jgi:zona occludens toxin
MILFHEGWPGSGKSYDAVQKVIDNLRRGRKVYSNIEGFDDPRHREALKCLSGLNDYDFNNQLIYLKKDEIYNFWTFVEKQSLVIIDEAHKFYNARNWQNKGNNEFADWCSTARHDGIDLILITQDVGKVDSQVRSLAEWIYRYKKINFMGSLVNRSYLCFAFPDQDSKQYMSKQAHRYDPKVFKCYKSYASKDIKELKIQNHTNVFKHPIFYLIPIMLLITGYYMSKSGVWHGDLFGMSSRKVNAAVVSAVQVNKPRSTAEPLKGLVAPIVKVESVSKKETGKEKKVFSDLTDQYAWVGGGDVYAILEDRSTGRQSIISDVISGGVVLIEEIKGKHLMVLSMLDDKVYKFQKGGRLPVAVTKIVNNVQFPEIVLQ